MKNMRDKVLFLTNYPSPYRVDFFNLLGKQVDLTVAFTEKPADQMHRSSEWFNEDYSGFRAVFLNDRIRIGRITVCRDVFALLKEDFNHIILGGYSNGTQMAAIEYMRLHKIPFTIEADGGLISRESRLRYWAKKHFIGSAQAFLSSGDATTAYLLYYGAKKDSIHHYPFSSQRESDLTMARDVSQEKKHSIRKKIGLTEEIIVISVGRFSYQRGYGKGYDTLLNVAESIDRNIGIYIIGDTPTEEFISFKNEKRLDHVHFIDFKAKDELAEYYAAADIFVLLTRRDVWGLVVNEAMAYGLPVITTEACGAGLSLIENGVNGFIVPVGETDVVIEKLKQIVASSEMRYKMALENRRKISIYSIENMVEAHMRFFESFIN